MPKYQIVSSSRAKATIAAVMAISSMVGGGYYVVRPNQALVPAAIGLASGTLVQPWEGRELRAYYDKIAKPAVWTICDGYTNARVRSSELHFRHRTFWPVPCAPNA